jgi:RNA polymerase sporulation-specific sigma factor
MLKNKDILDDYDFSYLQETFGDDLAEYSMRLDGLVRRVVDEMNAIPVKLKEIDTQLVNIKNSGIDIVDQASAKSGLKTLNEIEDAVQEATIALYAAVKSFNPQKSSFQSLANVCIKRSMIARLRKNNTQKAIPDELLIPIEDAEILYAQSPENILIEKEDLKNLKENIRLELSSMEYAVLQLFLEGKSYNEISKQMQITEKSVDNALARIRKKIAAI